ncbi:MAG: hypothetical protein FJW79_02675 [Actinobacteria bacterium]|nr:hypothetical protein [Actinomycetota bacterium]
MRSRRAATAWILILLLVVALVPVAGAEPGGAGPALPAGWSVEQRAAGPVLVYTLREPLPVRDARPEFRDGEILLGYPLQRPGRLELPVDAATLEALESPSAWLSARRLDGPTPLDVLVREPALDELPTGRLLAGKTDPGTPGPYATRNFSYRLNRLNVGFPVGVEVLADVIAPVGAPTPQPLVLFLHGRHSTCYSLDPAPFVTGDWPCPPGTLPIPSHRGYRYVAELLASQGYLTVSISANGINGQDWAAADGGATARSALIRHHLRLWAGWNATGGDPWGGIFKGAVDMKKVILVGHSRGGEGVERAAIDSAPDAGYTIVGLVPIGPTAFGRQVPAGIATAVILPYCDGDVVDLQGQQYIDQSRDLTHDRALRSSVLAIGTNHNFFNTEWTPGLAAAPADDDWLWAGPSDEPTCGPDGPGRLTPQEQQKVGATYIAALARAALRGDVASVGLLDGSQVRAASVGRARVLTHALGGRRSLVYRPRLTDYINTAGMSARPCRGYLPGDWGFQSECYPIGFDRLPHWLPMMGMESAPSPVALDLQWWRTGGTVRLALPETRDLTAATHLDLRLAVDVAFSSVQLGVRLVDRRGAVIDLPAAPRVPSLPGTAGPLGKIWAQTLRFDLTGARARFDLTQIAAVELVSRTGRGHAWLLDVHARRPGAVVTTPIALPRVSVATREVLEGGPGTRTVRLPLHIRGDVVAPATLWVSVFGPDGQQGYRLVLPPGTTRASVPIRVEGNDQFDPMVREYGVVIKALSQATTGQYIGALRLIDDEPAPVLTFEATRGRVAEGRTLVFTASLSFPVAADLWYSIQLDEVRGRPTLFTDDVTPEFMYQWAGWVPDPPQPLWQSVWAGLYIPAGATTATFEIPTVVDGIAEDPEVITVTLWGWDDPLLPVPITVRGVVRDS